MSNPSAKLEKINLRPPTSSVFSVLLSTIYVTYIEKACATSPHKDELAMAGPLIGFAIAFLLKVGYNILRIRVNSGWWKDETEEMMNSLQAIIQDPNSNPEEVADAQKKLKKLRDKQFELFMAKIDTKPIPEIPGAEDQK